MALWQTWNTCKCRMQRMADVEGGWFYTLIAYLALLAIVSGSVCLFMRWLAGGIVRAAIVMVIEL